NGTGHDKPHFAFTRKRGPRNAAHDSDLSVEESRLADDAALVRLPHRASDISSLEPLVVAHFLRDLVNVTRERIDDGEIAEAVSHCLFGIRPQDRFQARSGAPRISAAVSRTPLAPARIPFFLWQGRFSRS